MVLADFFTDGDHDALPSHHRAHAQSQGDGDLNPGGNELGGVVDVLLVVLRAPLHPRRRIVACRIFFFMRRSASLTTYMSLRKLRTLSSRGTALSSLILRHLGADVVDEFAQRQHGAGRELLGADVVGDFFARIADHRTGVDVVIQ